MKREYILKTEATTIPVLPKEQRVEFRNIDEAFEAGWKTCQEYIATCIEPADVISRHEAIREMKKIFSPCGEAGNGDAISREVVLAKLRNLKNPEQGADPGYPPFGSYGDSVTIDELQKKYRDNQQTFSNLQSEVINPGDNCWARLPCGICRNTMMHCPLSLMQPAWTCSSSTATNQTGGEEK